MDKFKNSNYLSKINTNIVIPSNIKTIGTDYDIHMSRISLWAER